MPYTEVRASITASRLTKYDEAARRCGQGEIAAVELYEWNAALSAAVYTHLHLVEVAMRNAISDELVGIYDDRWPWNERFLHSLGERRRNRWTMRQEIENLGEKHPTAGKVVADAKLVFWRQMLTTRFAVAIWEPRFDHAFPGTDSTVPVADRLAALYDDVEALRVLRNRVAHYEPIFHRDLARELDRIEGIAGSRSATVREWVEATGTARAVLDAPPAWYTP